MRTACHRYEIRDADHWIPPDAELSYGWAAAHPTNGKPHYPYFFIQSPGANPDTKAVFRYFPATEAGVGLGMALAKSLMEYGANQGCRELGYDVSNGRPTPKPGLDYAGGESLFLPVSYDSEAKPPLNMFYNMANPVVREWMVVRLTYIAERNGGRLFLDGGSPLRMDLINTDWMPGGSILERMRAWLNQVELILDTVDGRLAQPLQVIVNSGVRWPNNWTFMGSDEQNIALFWRWLRSPHVVGVMFENYWSKVLEANLDAYRKLVRHLAVEGKFAFFYSNAPTLEAAKRGYDKRITDLYCETEYLGNYMLLQSLHCSDDIVVHLRHPADYYAYPWMVNL